MRVIFRSSLEEVHSFTLSIRMHGGLSCDQCKAEGQFVPHGWLYKSNDDGTLRQVGKRILCDQRRGGAGCGATTRVLVRNETHRLHVDTAQLMLFLWALIAGMTVLASYEKATRTSMSRNAWRWWQKLKNRMVDIREDVFKNSAICPADSKENSALVNNLEFPQVSPSASYARKSRQTLCEVLVRWLQKDPDLDTCAQFQELRQIALL